MVRNRPISCDTSDATKVAGSTFVSDVSVTIEQAEEEEKIPNGDESLYLSSDDQDTSEPQYTILPPHVLDRCRHWGGGDVTSN